MKLHFFVGIAISLILVFGFCRSPLPAIAGLDTGLIPGTKVFPFETTMVDTNWQVPMMPPIRTGAEQMNLYLEKLEGKKLGLVVNHSSLIGDTHLVDSLLALGMDIVLLFAPEHGFRGTADAGATVKDGQDVSSGLPIRSLYGSNKKPKQSDINKLDLVLFDAQDVGARFYTYISTLHYVMEACAENNVPLLLLDRPNPNAHYIDGPVLNPEFSSFVGMHPVPVVYGMTIGEFAQMINGEGWLNGGIKCDLEVVPLAWYHHQRAYDLPVRPSPNLPNALSIQLYPSLCFFEGTQINAGRGTDIPFQCYGAPALLKGNYTYTPQSNFGAKYPKHKGQNCTGYNLSDLDWMALHDKPGIDLTYLLESYIFYAEPDAFFLENGFFDLLAGTDQLRKQILAGWTEAQIRESWKEDLDAFKLVRKKYLIY